MKRAAELYPNFEWCESDYQPMLNEFGRILLQVDDKDYHGDSRVLYLKDGKIGWLQFGWGSCSGCDALQACQTVEKIQELMDRLYNEIQWFDSVAEARTFFKTHDWEGDYSWRIKKQEEFVEKAIEILELGKEVSRG